MPELIVSDDEFAAAIEDLATADRYALDTEFHRERTYYPHVALVQLAWNDRLVLVDPLAVDLRPLAQVLDGPGLCVLHAGTQDLEVLELSCGTVPSRLFDTQVAAGFLGVATGSLVSLLERFLNTTIPKGDRLTDWLRRPLTEDQLNYAAGDVLHLLELTDIITAELVEMGRLDWANEESALVLSKPRNKRPPEEAVLRIKEARSLKGKALRIATALAAWRERRAAELDIPIRQVMPDIAVVAIAQQAPSGVDGLKKIRGLDSRHLRKGADNEILTAVAAGIAADDPVKPPQRSNDLPRQLRPVVTLVTSWIAQLARDHKLDPAILATRSDVENLLSSSGGRLTSGWRADLVGEPIGALVNGAAALAFDGDGRLVLEERSNVPLTGAAAKEE